MHKLYLETSAAVTIMSTTERLTARFLPRDHDAFVSGNRSSPYQRYGQSAPKARGGSSMRLSSFGRYEQSVLCSESRLVFPFCLITDASRGTGMANSLDFTLVPGTESSAGGSCGAPMGRRRDLSTESKNMALGPGKYDVKLREHTQTAVFGSESRRYEQPSERPFSRTYIDIFSATTDSTRPKSVAYSFGVGNSRRSRSVLRGSGEVPGPGAYNCVSHRVRTVPTPCFVASCEGTLEKVAPNLYYDVAICSQQQQSARERRRGFQKFSTLGRFMNKTSRCVAARRGLNKSCSTGAGTGRNIVERNAKTAGLERPAEKMRRLVLSKRKLESMIQAAKTAKESIQQ